MAEPLDAPESRATTYRRGHDHFTDPIITITDGQLTLGWPPAYPSEAVVHRDVLVDLVERANTQRVVVDVEQIVVHSDDRVLLRSRTPIDAQTAENVTHAVARVLGPGRAVFVADVDVIVVRPTSAPGTPDDDSDAQLAAIDFHHQQTRI